jgi:hypothetical protein
MKKNYIFTLLIALTTAVSFGQALVAEDFDYGASSGDLTAVSSGTWVNHSGTTVVAYATTGLTMAGYPSSGVGGSAMISPSGSEDVNRTFTAQTSGNVYGSALVSISAVGSGDYFIHLKDTGNNFRARVGAKDDGSGKILFGIGAVSSTLTYGTSVFDLDTTYLLVFSYNIDNGESKLYVLTAVTSTEPTAAEATNSGTAGTEISSVAMRQASNIPSASIDGIRVALNWSDIMSNATASIKDNTIEGFATYPNPITNSTFTITSNSSSKKTITIFNVLGKKVLSSSFSGVKSNIDVSTISAGIYILKVTEGGKTASKKLVIR